VNVKVDVVCSASALEMTTPIIIASPSSPLAPAVSIARLVTPAPDVHMRNERTLLIPQLASERKALSSADMRTAVAARRNGPPPTKREGRRITLTAPMLSSGMTHNDRQPPGSGAADAAHTPIAIATILRGDGITGVDTHIRQVRNYLIGVGAPCTLISPYSWARPLTYPVFGIRPLVLDRISGPASVAWYLHWHAVFVREALRRHLAAATSDCVVYAQDPFTARAALRVRRGPHQRVILGVHFRISMADEWVDKKRIKRGDIVYRAIRRVEREVVPAVDRILFVSSWGRDALLAWLPQAATVPSAVIGNFVAPGPAAVDTKPLGDLVTVGNLDLVKNHRYLLAVLAQANQRGHRLSLDVFGDGPCRKDLLQQANDLGLGGQVRFHGFRSDVRDFLCRYRVYVHASYSESLPLAIIEAMAAGLPIVAADIGGISELCDEGAEARFWPLDDPAEAAAILTDLLASEPRRRAAATASARRFFRDFDARVVGPRLLHFLNGDVKSSGGQSGRDVPVGN
jgi:glycosyltransferase involved in cell wall biosynthesis